MTVGTNDIFFHIKKALSLSDEEILKIYALEDHPMTQERLDDIFKSHQVDCIEPCSHEELGVFLDGLITHKRGPSPKKPSDDESVELTNNLILKKLRIALELKEPETEIIFGLGDALLSKQELKSLFRKEDHKNFKPCSDTLLISFLEGLDEFYYSGPEI